MIAAGFGCRRATGADAILAAYRAALAIYDVERADVMATADIKRDEFGLVFAGALAGFSFRFLSSNALAAVAWKSLTRSEASLMATSLPSLAEAAALAACGGDGRLLGPRVALGSVTCALATTELAF